MKKVRTHCGSSIYEHREAELRQAIDMMGCILPRYEVYLPDESSDAMNAA